MGIVGVVAQANAFLESPVPTAKEVFAVNYFRVS